MILLYESVIEEEVGFDLKEMKISMFFKLEIKIFMVLFLLNLMIDYFMLKLFHNISSLILKYRRLNTIYLAIVITIYSN